MILRNGSEIVIETARPLFAKHAWHRLKAGGPQAPHDERREFGKTPTTVWVVFGSNCGCASIKEVNFSCLTKYSTSAFVAFECFARNDIVTIVVVIIIIIVFVVRSGIFPSSHLPLFLSIPTHSQFLLHLLSFANSQTYSHDHASFFVW